MMYRACIQKSEHELVFATSVLYFNFRSEVKAMASVLPRARKSLLLPPPQCGPLAAYYCGEISRNVESCGPIASVRSTVAPAGSVLSGVPAHTSINVLAPVCV